MAGSQLLVALRPTSVKTSLALLPQLASSPRAIVFALIGATFATFLYAVTTAVIPNPFFIRMTPVRPLDYLFLALGVALFATLTATYALPGPERGVNRGVAGGILAGLAIGCPVCNKVVVAVLGVAGALSYFEPIQPLLGVFGIALLALGVLVQLDGAAACRTPTPLPRQS
ncbi:MAG: hypothetical protein ABJB39_03675 [Chloroflexota bacterium]